MIKKWSEQSRKLSEISLKKEKLRLVSRDTDDCFFLKFSILVLSLGGKMGREQTGCKSRKLARMANQ